MKNISKFFYREPLSLAKMGQRLTAKSVFDMTTEPVAPSNGQMDMTPPTIRRLSGIPTRRGSISVTSLDIIQKNREITAVIY